MENTSSCLLAKNAPLSQRRAGDLNLTTEFSAKDAAAALNCTLWTGTKDTIRFRVIEGSPQKTGIAFFVAHAFSRMTLLQEKTGVRAPACVRCPFSQVAAPVIQKGFSFVDVYGILIMEGRI